MAPMVAMMVLTLILAMVNNNDGGTIDDCNRNNDGTNANAADDRCPPLGGDQFEYFATKLPTHLLKETLRTNTHSSHNVPLILQTQYLNGFKLSIHLLKPPVRHNTNSSNNVVLIVQTQRINGVALILWGR